MKTFSVRNLPHLLRKRLAALFFALLLLLPASGCMSLYLLSEQFDPNGTWLGAEPEMTPAIELTPAPTAAVSAVPYVSIIQNDTGITFSDMVYVRPDTAVIDSALDALEAAMDDPESDADALLSLYAEMLARYEEASDAMSLAYVLYSMDVTEAYYQDEYDALVVALTEDDVRMTDLSIALFDDVRTAEAMRQTYGEDFIRTVTEGRELNSPEIQQYVEREQKLIGEYDTLNTTFVYREKGRTYTMAEISAIAEADYDEYVRLYTAYYAAFNREAGKIFLELVDLRDTIAKTLGFDNYTEYQYRCYNRDYTPADAQALHMAVKQHIVPLYFNGILSFYMEEGYDTVDAIAVTEESFYRKLREELGEVSPEALEAFDYMRKNELCTTEQSDVKMEASYSTYLGGYDSPYLFTEWTDDIRSAATIMHELGHFTRFCIEPAEGWSVVDPLDILEIDSQGLEMMLVPEYEDFYGEAGKMAAKSHLLDGLYAMITGCMEDEFQQIVYANPDMTLEQMNTVYLGLAGAYGMVDLYGFAGTEWAVIPHTFQSPLYYISYAVSVIPALELYVMAEENEDAAAATYRAVLHRPTYTALREVMAENGLSDPLAEQTIIALAKALEQPLVG